MQQQHDPRLEALLAALPRPARRGMEAALEPRARWWRLPLGVALVPAGCLGFLPVLGFWMLPLGLILLSQDVSVLREPTLRGLDAVHRRWRRARR